MLDLFELEQLVAFADCGRLSRAAEKLHLSQPTVTRTMQHLEDEFGVPLFERGKNRITLNETGQKAVEIARGLLSSEEAAVREVRAYDRSLHTITLSSCAPAPLWVLLPALSSAFPGLTLSSRVKNNQGVLSDLASQECNLAVLPCPHPLETYRSIPFLKERLYLCVPPDHALARCPEVSFEDLNGYNFLLASHLGFWYDLILEKMPSSRFHVQSSDLAMEELIRSSSMPCFVSNLSQNRRSSINGRTTIPITDPEANVTFYLVFLIEGQKYADTYTRIAASCTRD